MKPMGSKVEQPTLEEFKAAVQENERQKIEALLGHEESKLDEEQTEIAYPEERYGVACIICGVEAHLQMIPHRDKYNLLVGWVFCCEEHRTSIIGRRVWFGDTEEK